MRHFSLSVLASAGMLVLLGACASPAKNEPAATTPVSQAAPASTPPAALLANDWRLTEWRDHAIPQTGDGEPVLVRFAEDGRVSGHSGCNRFFAPYTVTAQQDMRITAPGSTRMACEPQFMKFESEFLGALAKVAGFSFKDNRLTLTTSDGEAMVYQAFRAPSAQGGAAPAPSSSMELDIAPQRAACTGVAPMQCLKVRRTATGPWEFWYSEIEGFNFKPGYAYRIRVSSQKVANPPADGSSIRYKLEKIISQQRVAGKAAK